MGDITMNGQQVLTTVTQDGDYIVCVHHVQHSSPQSHQVVFSHRMDIVTARNFVMLLDDAIQQIHAQHGATLPVKSYNPTSGRSHA